MTTGTLRTRCKVQRYATRLWSLFFLARALTGTVILIMAVAATGLCYLLALPVILLTRLNRP